MTKTSRKRNIWIANRQRIVNAPAFVVRSAAEAAAAYAGGPDGNLSIVLVGSRKMRRLNRDFAGVDCVTDVLAFDLAGGGQPAPDDIAGEVVVNASLAKTEAAVRGIEPIDELLLYVVHGVLHLAGYRDDTPASRRRMRAAEAAALRKLQANPPR